VSASLRNRPLPPDYRDRLASYARMHGHKDAAKTLNVGPDTLARAIAGFPIRNITALVLITIFDGLATNNNKAKRPFMHDT
jgi:hypothetical protein